MCSTVCIQSLNSDVSTFASEIPFKWTNTPLKWKPTGLTKLLLAPTATRPIPRPVVRLPAAVAVTAGDALVHEALPSRWGQPVQQLCLLLDTFRSSLTRLQLQGMLLRKPAVQPTKDWRNDSPAQQPPERCRRQRSRASSVHNSSTRPDTASHLPTHLRQLFCSLY